MALPRPTFMLLMLGTLAAVGAGASNPMEWTPADIVRAESAGSWSVAPDGSLAVWVRSGVEDVSGEPKRVSNLWLTRLPAGASVQLTRGTDTIRGPQLSPDARHVAFLSTRAIPGAGEGLGGTQLWAIATDGGEAFPVTRFDRDVQSFGWASPGSLIVAAPESPSAWELERKEEKDDSQVVDDETNEPPVRLFRVELASGKARRLTANTDWIDELSVSPDGARAVVIAHRSLSYEFDQRVAPRAFLVDLGSGESRQVLDDGMLLAHRVRWAPDGRGFYFANEHTRHPRYRTATVTQLFYFDLASGRAAEVNLDWPRGLGGDYTPVEDGVLALLADGVRFRPAHIARAGAGWRRNDLLGAHTANIEGLAASRDGAVIVYEHSTAARPPQWFAARHSGARLTGERVLTELNRAYAEKPTGRVEVVRWKGALDEEVEGLLHYPLGYEPGRRFPLILDIHGGPTGTDMDLWSQSWASPVILWRQKGAFVLQVNYHGSAGYGLDWVESIAGRYYELEIPDIERGVDEMIRRGLADPERLATSGWSNGGILSAELVTRTTRYRAASIGAADIEWFSDWANVDFGAAFDNYYFGGAPWEVPQTYLDKSPFFRLTEVTTPTIVYTGTDDTNVPPHQSRSLFRALQQIGKAPVRLVLFPDEPHSLRNPVRQLRKIDEDLAWFDRYLFDQPAAEANAVRPDSPLAGLIARARAARVDGRLGRLDGGLLAPETVAFAGLEIGLFEVTRAQWAEFEPGEPGGGDPDLPATGMSFERANAYAAWLATRTGRPVRLPTVEEARRLAAAAGGGGNTLDRWAGYTPNPDDGRRLLEAVAPLGQAPLLRPVGSGAAAGEEGPFDLDGNAAEWAQAPQGGEAVGPSADRSTDARCGARPAPAYTGLRIVVGR